MTQATGRGRHVSMGVQIQHLSPSLLLHQETRTRHLPQPFPKLRASTILREQKLKGRLVHAAPRERATLRYRIRRPKLRSPVTTHHDRTRQGQKERHLVPKGIEPSTFSLQVLVLG